MRDEKHFHVSDYPMVCTFTGPDGHGFIHKGVLQRMRTQESLKQEPNRAIRNEIAAVNQELSCREFDSFLKHIRRCAASKGEHFPRCYLSKVIIHK